MAGNPFKGEFEYRCEDGHTYRKRNFDRRCTVKVRKHELHPYDPDSVSCCHVQTLCLKPVEAVAFYKDEKGGDE